MFVCTFAEQSELNQSMLLAAMLAQVDCLLRSTPPTPPMMAQFTLKGFARLCVCVCLVSVKRISMCMWCSASARSRRLEWGYFYSAPVPLWAVATYATAAKATESSAPVYAASQYYADIQPHGCATYKCIGQVTWRTNSRSYYSVCVCSLTCFPA